MRKVFIILFFLLISTKSYAGFNICDEGRLVKKGSSPIEGCLYFNDDNINEYNRVKTLFGSTRRDFLKIENGIVVEKTQAEKDSILQSEADAQAQAIEDALDKFEVSNIELMTALIQRINVRIADDITKQEIIDQIKANR